MERPRLALLVAAHEPEDAIRNFRRELPADLVEYRVTEGEFPVADDLDGFVVTGSKSSVYDDLDWIEETTTWTAAAIDDGVPALGVCFGHQLLAAALGGTVESMGKYELGYHQISHEDDPVFAGIDSPFLAFTTHSDTVTALPEGATRIAENEYGVQAFRKGTTVGVQFHPEYDLQTATRVAEGKDVPPEQWAEVEAGLTERNRNRAAEAALVFENFVADVERRALQ